MAPGASLVSLKVLDANGQGTISNILAALNWIVANNKTYNIRVVNMSVGAQIRESYFTDPLTLAVKRVTDLGITVVCAAGNFGKNTLGALQLGGITAPANAPWVLTVGASSTNGSLTRNDDTMASFSSSGPTAIDFLSKPDLVAPGVGTVSLAVPGSSFYSSKAAFLVGPKGMIKLSTMRTCWPRRRSSSARCEPMKPAPPVTRYEATGLRQFAGKPALGIPGVMRIAFW